jgi:hypothetical protein
MWLISVIVFVPVIYLAIGRPVPTELTDRLQQWFPLDSPPTQQHLALAFIAGAFVGGTPLHIVFKYLATVVHELGHAFTAGILGGRPKNITIAPSTAGLATYQPPMSWGRGRATLVSLAGYPAPAIASLAAVRSLQGGHTLAWFFFATGTLALAIVMLIRNLWGFTWTLAAVAGAYFAARELSVEALGYAVAGLAGYLAIEGYRHAFTQVTIIRRFPGAGCDAERVAFWWKQNPRFIGTVHLVSVTAIGAYASYLAVNPYWEEILNWIKKVTKTE